MKYNELHFYFWQVKEKGKMERKKMDLKFRMSCKSLQIFDAIFVFASVISGLFDVAYRVLSRILFQRLLPLMQLYQLLVHWKH